MADNIEWEDLSAKLDKLTKLMEHRGAMATSRLDRLESSVEAMMKGVETLTNSVDGLRFPFKASNTIVESAVDVVTSSNNTQIASAIKDALEDADLKGYSLRTWESSQEHFTTTTDDALKENKSVVVSDSKTCSASSLISQFADDINNQDAHSMVIDDEVWLGCSYPSHWPMLFSIFKAVCSECALEIEDRFGPCEDFCCLVLFWDKPNIWDLHGLITVSVFDPGGFSNVFVFLANLGSTLFGMPFTFLRKRCNWPLDMKTGILGWNVTFITYFLTEHHEKIRKLKADHKHTQTHMYFYLIFNARLNCTLNNNGHIWCNLHQLLDQGHGSVPQQLLNVSELGHINGVLKLMVLTNKEEKMPGSLMPEALITLKCCDNFSMECWDLLGEFEALQEDANEVHKSRKYVYVHHPVFYSFLRELCMETSSDCFAKLCCDGLTMVDHIGVSYKEAKSISDLVFDHGGIYCIEQLFAYNLAYCSMSFTYLRKCLMISPSCRAPSWSEWLDNKVLKNLLYLYGMCRDQIICYMERYHKNHLVEDIFLIMYQFQAVIAFSAVINCLGQFDDILDSNCSSKPHVDKEDFILVFGNLCVHVVSGVDGKVLWKRDLLGESIDVQHVIQSPHDNVISVADLSSSSKFYVYQFNAKNGNLLMNDDVSLPFDTFGEFLSISGDVLVVLDDMRTKTVTIHLKNGEISYNQKHISDLIEDSIGPAVILPSRLPGMFALNLNSHLILLKLTSEGELLVVDKINNVATCSVALSISKGLYAFAFVEHGDTKIYLYVTDVNAWNNDLLKESIVIDHQGTLYSMVVVIQWISEASIYMVMIQWVNATLHLLLHDSISGENSSRLVKWIKLCMIITKVIVGGHGYLKIKVSMESNFYAQTTTSSLIYFGVIVAKQYLTFDLEDKVLLKGGGNVMNQGWPKRGPSELGITYRACKKENMHTKAHMKSLNTKRIK